MHNDPQRVIDRATRLLRERVRPAVEVASVPLDVTVRDLPGEPEPFAAATTAGEHRRIAVGDAWGPAWTTSWFHLTGTVPTGWADTVARMGATTVGPLVALVDIGFAPDSGPGFQCEGLVLTADGTIVKGIHPKSQWVPLDPATTVVDLWVEGAANPDIASVSFLPTHLGDGIAPDGPPLYRLQRADIAVLDPEVQALEIDLELLIGWAEELPVDRPRRVRILAALDRACDAIDLDDVRGTAVDARDVLAPELARRADASAHRVKAIAHAHIDSAWLWPTRETVRKCTRTFSNVLDLMDRYPSFNFACSQAQQYAWVEETHPELLARITERVAEGRWIPAGGMWVESDTNLPGGEALVRQFVHGKRYFAEKFGFEPEEVWLPDSFGYTAALPQIAKLAGYRWFLTQKLSWGSPIDRFPHHTFWWQGIDGTTLFSHMPPVDNYLSELTPREMEHAQTNFRDAGGATMSVVPFGHGDGGGGPTAIMIERAARQADLEGAPVIEHATPESFFREAEAEYEDAPTWVGELYLEAHRGTYTSQAAMKQGNRRSEHLLREAELWSATATVRHGVPYPSEALDRLWKVVLLHQFHDILPGSGIAWVHRQAAEAYAEVAQELEGIIGTALDVLAGDGDVPLAFNATPAATDGVPALGAATAGGDHGLQAGFTPVTVEQDDDRTVLDNGILRIALDRTGGATSVVDLRRGRELVAPGGRLGDLVLHQDFPNRFDAWDVDEHYLRTATVLEEVDDLHVEHDDDGSATVVVQRWFGRSSALQRTTLRPGAGEIDYTTEVDWHEADRLLKVTFPLDVLTDTSSSEIQFGHIARPTHGNTTWDAAKFEICAHRWVHVGEPGFGVAVANDSTYGHDIRRRDAEGSLPGTEVRLSLLRAPRFPDPETDQGVHRFSYRLVSDAAIADAVDAGYRVNLPVRTRSGAGPVAPLVRVTDASGGDRSGVIVESVKIAEDSSGDLVVRLYEALGARTTATVAWDLPSSGAVVTDLLERRVDAPIGTVVTDDSATLPFRPFQIVTLRIRRGAGLEEEIR